MSYKYIGKSKKLIRDELFSEIIDSDLTAKQLSQLIDKVRSMKEEPKESRPKRSLWTRILSKKDVDEIISRDNLELNVDELSGPVSLTCHKDIHGSWLLFFQHRDSKGLCPLYMDSYQLITKTKKDANRMIEYISNALNDYEK